MQLSAANIPSAPGSISADPQVLIDWASELHHSECDNGQATFPQPPWSALDGSPAPARAALAAPPAVSYRSSSIGVGNAGPDEGLLNDGHLVHATTAPILSSAECSAVIDEAGGAMATGKTSRFTYTAASRLGEVHVSELPRSREWLARRLHDTLFPMLRERFLPAGAEAEELAVYDALVIKYDASRGGTRQPMHRDGALFSVNIALNDAFDGGGTRFEGNGEVYTQPMGHAMMHASGARHAGHPIVRGERWVLVVFVLARRVPQAARRLGERAIEYRREGAPTSRVRTSRRRCSSRPPITSSTMAWGRWRRRRAAATRRKARGAASAARASSTAVPQASQRPRIDAARCGPDARRPPLV